MTPPGWNYDLSRAPFDVQIFVSYGELVRHDCIPAKRLPTHFIDEYGMPIHDAYAWQNYPLAASYNEPEKTA